MMKWVIITLAIRLLFLTSCGSMTVSKRGSNIQICGRMLAETLNLLCQGQYYDPEEESTANSISKRDVSQQASADFYSSWPLCWPYCWPSPKINNLNRQYPVNRRQVHGVVDECCRKPCSTTVLMSYCRAPSV